MVPDLLLLKARALLEGGTRKEEWVRAGWAFMRVVIHFKDDPAAARASGEHMLPSVAPRQSPAKSREVSPWHAPVHLIPLRPTSRIGGGRRG